MQYLGTGRYVLFLLLFIISVLANYATGNRGFAFHNIMFCFLYIYFIE